MEKITKIEAIALVVIIFMTEVVLNLSTTVLRHTGNGVLLNAITISIIAITFCVFISKLFKPFENKGLLEISEYLGGKFLKNLLGFLYIMFFLITTATLVRYFANSLKLIYFNDVNISFIILLFLVPALIVNKLGLRGLLKVNLAVTPVLLISILILAFSISNKFRPENIFPILRLSEQMKLLYLELQTYVFLIVLDIYIFYLHYLKT